MKKVFSMVFIALCCQNIHASFNPKVFLASAATAVAASVIIHKTLNNQQPQNPNPLSSEINSLNNKIVKIESKQENQSAILKEHNQRLISLNNDLQNKQPVCNNDQSEQITKTAEQKLEPTSAVHNDQEQTVAKHDHFNITPTGIVYAIGLSVVVPAAMFLGNALFRIRA